MSLQLTNREGFSFTPSQLVSLFTLDGTNIGLSVIYRFYAGSSEMIRPIVFNGEEYLPFPVESDGFEMDGKGSLPRPRISLSNINGFVSRIVLQNENVIGAAFTRKRVYARFLDAVNFRGGVNPYGTPDPEGGFEPETFYVNRKISETQQSISFELAAQIELENVTLPRRTIYAQVCPFRFRDPLTCGYAGAPLTDSNNKTFVAYGLTLVDLGEYNSATTYNAGDYVYVTSVLLKTAGDKTYYVCRTNGTTGLSNGPIKQPNNWLVDSCSQSVLGCKIHFTSGVLPFGGYPGVSRAAFNFATQ